MRMNQLSSTIRLFCHIYDPKSFTQFRTSALKFEMFRIVKRIGVGGDERGQIVGDIVDLGKCFKVFRNLQDDVLNFLIHLEEGKQFESN